MAESDIHHERRRVSPEPARERRVQQREAWELSSHPDESERPSTGNPEGEYVDESFATALGAVVDAALRLPRNDKATALQARLARITETSSRDDARQAARALVEATHDALREDPWVRVHLAALELDAALRDR
jgi:hypothetical protein